MRSFFLSISTQSFSQKAYCRHDLGTRTEFSVLRLCSSSQILCRWGRSVSHENEWTILEARPLHLGSLCSSQGRSTLHRTYDKPSPAAYLGVLVQGRRNYLPRNTARPFFAFSAEHDGNRRIQNFQVIYLQRVMPN